MGLAYYPRPGEILVCHYDRVAMGAEMIKSRPVVVIGPRLRRRGNLVGVVPLSTTDPAPAENYHCRLELTAALPAPFDRPVMWAKCDMYGSVALERLDRFKLAPRQRGARRQWVAGKVSDEQLAQLRKAVLHGLGFAQP